MWINRRNEKRFVKPEEISEIKNIVEFEVISPRGCVILTTEEGEKINCKSHDYEEFLKMIKVSRETGAKYIK